MTSALLILILTTPVAAWHIPTHTSYAAGRSDYLERSFASPANEKSVKTETEITGTVRLPFGDMDGDLDVDLSDYGFLQFCLEISGPETDIHPVCSLLADTDADDDIDVDLLDIRVFFSEFTGSTFAPTCGNGVVEIPFEACDPPNGSTCDINCQLTNGGQLANDSCGNPTNIGNGQYKFATVGATTDGPDEPGQCVIQNYTHVDADVWFCYTATATEQVVLSLCGSGHDTKMLVYDGCGCPTDASSRIACSDDDCGTGTESRAMINSIEGQQYMVRIGGFEGVTSTQGILTIFPVSDPARGINACNAGAGTCFAAHGNPGCEIFDACSATCNVDQFCCDVEWDSVCATKADGITNGFDACGADGAGSCLHPSNPNTPTVGCDDPSCCQPVCVSDPYCCLTEWDSFCADSVGEVCGLFVACTNTTASCFTVHTGPGCSLTTCCNQICELDPYCCSDSGWDDVCVEAANALRQSGQCLP